VAGFGAGLPGTKCGTSPFTIRQTPALFQVQPHDGAVDRAAGVVELPLSHRSEARAEFLDLSPDGPRLDGEVSIELHLIETIGETREVLVHQPFPLKQPRSLHKLREVLVNAEVHLAGLLEIDRVLCSDGLHSLDLLLDGLLLVSFEPETIDALCEVTIALLEEGNEHPLKITIRFAVCPRRLIVKHHSLRGMRIALTSPILDQLLSSDVRVGNVRRNIEADELPYRIPHDGCGVGGFVRQLDAVRFCGGHDDTLQIMRLSAKLNTKFLYDIIYVFLLSVKYVPTCS
jgi:hypothetical protein